MKPTHRWTNITEIYVNNKYSVPSKACTKMQVTFTIDARHILLAIADLIICTWEDGKGYQICNRKKISKKAIEDKIRDNLHYKGTYPVEYEDRFSEEERDEDLLNKVVRIANELYPEFMGVSNAVDFITKLKSGQ
jgi:ABC-type branched-subunit amino acid transport system substrate-binding protein